jgi:hypothetical protein
VKSTLFSGELAKLEQPQLHRPGQVLHACI